MSNTIPDISLINLLFSFIPVLLVVIALYWWSLEVRVTLYAVGRMLLQLLLIGYALTYLFETEYNVVTIAVLVVMMLISAWIALRPLLQKNFQLYMKSLVAIALSGTAVLFFTTEIVLELDASFIPRYIIPLGGMVYANAMNVVSLAAERFEKELIDNRIPYQEARQIALRTSLIPSINTLLAVGLVSLPGMMTGQILAGVSPLIAVRYQVVIMCMIFGAGALAAFFYLLWSKPATSVTTSELN